LPYGIEGFCSARNLQKEDGSKSEVGDSLDFKVLEFSKDDRRIVLSHKAMWSAEEEKPAAKPAAAQQKGGKGPVKNKAIDSINQATEKSTLGDIDALSALRDRMSGNESKSE
jgi:small subunit ribosomal protein S1